MHQKRASSGSRASHAGPVDPCKSKTRHTRLKPEVNKGTKNFSRQQPLHQSTATASAEPFELPHARKSVPTTKQQQPMYTGT